MLESTVRESVRGVCPEILANRLRRIFRVNVAPEWAPFRHQGGSLESGTLYVEDIGAIPGSLRVKGIEHYQFRMRVLAGTGDFILTSVPVDQRYERYNREHLGLGDPMWVLARSSGVSPIHVAQSCLHDPTALKSLVHYAKTGRLRRICPYMGIEDVWSLARVVSELSGMLVSVVAPPPNITKMANDKSFITRLVHLAIGKERTVETAATKTLDEATDRLREMAGRHDCVAVKLNSHASATGNLVLRAADVKRLSKNGVRDELSRFLSEAVWDGREEMCVVEWRNDVTMSPSSQLWIPSRGEPLLEGLYEQHLLGKEKVFTGSRPLDPLHPIAVVLKEQSLLLASILRRLGYVGRCSFDAIVCGGSDLKFVECNGRWGGTSLPMALVRRMFPDGAQYFAQDCHDDDLVGKDFSAAIEKYGRSLFDKNNGRGKYILYNAGGMKPLGKYSRIRLYSQSG